MRKKGKDSKPPSLDLFLKKRNENELPRRGISLPQIDYKKIRKAAEKRDALQRKRDEIQYPLYKSWFEAIGITKDQWDMIGKQEDSLNGNHRENIINNATFPIDSSMPQMSLCRKVIIWECQQKVCVDHPVPFDVDEYWLEGGGNLSEESGPNFNGNHCAYYAQVDGSSYRDWGMYHRNIKESTGSICLRASTVLVEAAKVREVGLKFDGPLQGATGGMANGLYLDGQVFTFLPNSYGDGRQSITFQVSIEIPGGELIRHVPSSESTLIFNDPPRVEQNYADPYLEGGSYPALPSSRVLNLNQVFPAGTFFLVEARISHWILACGKEAFASVWHNFDAQPYINMESCSWEWPP